MNKIYYLAAVIVIIIIGSVFVRSNKTEAPIETMSQTSSSTTLASGKYEIDLENSYITWGAEFVSGLNREEGKVKLKSGVVSVDEGRVMSGIFEIDMNSISDNQNKERLVKHLKSEDFFAVEKFPSSIFEITSFAPVDENSLDSGRYVVSGNLTIKNISKPISFISEVYMVDEAIESNAQFAINRAEWDVRYNSNSFFQNLGDKAIRDAVEIGLVLKAKKLVE